MDVDGWDNEEDEISDLRQTYIGFSSSPHHVCPPFIGDHQPTLTHQNTNPRLAEDMVHGHNVLQILLDRY